ERIRSHMNSIPQHVRLERYRLIVAAHAILSDPLRRSAYDRYGAGWNGHPEAAGRSRGRASWGNGPDPMQNATWEDWERFYQHSNSGGAAHGQQTPIWMSNGAFVALIMMVAALGGVGQATRAGNYAQTLVDQRDRVHNEASRNLRHAMQSARGLNRE